jgi:hypothetical protein
MTTKALLGFTVVTLAALIARVEGIADCAPDRKPSGPVEFAREPAIPPVDKQLKINAKNIADLIKRGHTPAARKLAQAVVPKLDEFYDVAELYRARNKTGLGWGSMPQPIAVQDGLERTLMIFARGVPPAALNTPGNNEEAALWIAAIAELTIAMAPKKDRPRGQTRAAWLLWSDQLVGASLGFRQASADNNPKAMQQAAAKILTVCNNCHNVFRE